MYILFISFSFLSLALVNDYIAHFLSEPIRILTIFIFTLLLPLGMTAAIYEYRKYKQLYGKE